MTLVDLRDVRGVNVKLQKSKKSKAEVELGLTGGFGVCHIAHTETAPVGVAVIKVQKSPILWFDLLYWRLEHEYLHLLMI